MARPMVITAVLCFEHDGGLPFSTFVDVVVARLAQQARFRRRARSRRRGDVWVEVEGFDPRAHVERVDGIGADDEALRAVVSHGDDVHIAVAADSALPHDPAALVAGLTRRLLGAVAG